MAATGLVVLAGLAFGALWWFSDDRGGGGGISSATSISVQLPAGSEPSGGSAPRAEIIQDLASLPPLDDGAELLAAGKFEPAGSVFGEGVNVTWPLQKPQRPGGQLWIVLLAPDGNTWAGTGETATIAEDGRTASGRVWHFTTMGLANKLVPEHGLKVQVVREGAPSRKLAGAEVVVTFPGRSAGLATAKTDNTGTVIFPSLPGTAAKYEVHVVLAEYQPKTIQIEKHFEMPLTEKVELKKLKPDPQEQVVFHLSRDGKSIPPVSFSERSWDMTPEEIQAIIAEETRLYAPDKWLLVPPGREIKAGNSKLPGYRVEVNEPTRSQICGGLALSPLIGGPFALPTDKAWEIVKEFGEPVTGAPQAGDVVVWKNNGDVKHFGLVSDVVEATGTIQVYTKETWERVWLGYAKHFPTEKDFGDFELHRIDWDTIDVTREGDPATPLQPRAGVVRCSSLPRVPVALAMVGACDDAAGSLGAGKYTLYGTKHWGENTDEGTVTYGECFGKARNQTSGEGWKLTCNIQRSPEEAESRWRSGQLIYDRTLFEEAELERERIQQPKEKYFQLQRQRGPVIAVDCKLFWLDGRYIFIFETERPVLPGGGGIEAAIRAAKADAETLFRITKKHARLQKIELPMRPVGFPGRR